MTQEAFNKKIRLERKLELMKWRKELLVDMEYDIINKRIITAKEKGIMSSILSRMIKKLSP